MTDNIREVGKAVFEAADALLDRWGRAYDSDFGSSEVRLGVGHIQRQSARGGMLIRFGPEYHNHFYVTIYSDGRVTDDVFYAEKIINGVVQYLASKDWEDKTEGCVHRMKAIRRALE